MPSLGMADINGFTSPWRCLVIEDDEANAGHIAKAFREQGYEVQVCGDGSEALRLGLAETWDPHVARWRRRTRGAGRTEPARPRDAGAGRQRAERSRPEGARTPAGGDDYLTKPFEISELLARAEAVIRRCRPPALNRKLEVADLSLDLFTARRERGPIIPLQPREPAARVLHEPLRPDADAQDAAGSRLGLPPIPGPT